MRDRAVYSWPWETAGQTKSTTVGCNTLSRRQRSKLGGDAGTRRTGCLQDRIVVAMVARAACGSLHKDPTPAAETKHERRDS